MSTINITVILYALQSHISYNRRRTCRAIVFHFDRNNVAPRQFASPAERDVHKSVLSQMPRLQTTYFSLRVSDGSDHRACCSDRGVPRRCLEWCRGEPVNNKMCVLSYSKSILACFHELRGMSSSSSFVAAFPQKYAARTKQSVAPFARAARVARNAADVDPSTKSDESETVLLVFFPSTEYVQLASLNADICHCQR